jgi:hypothetical protein
MLGTVVVLTGDARLVGVVSLWRLEEAESEPGRCTMPTYTMRRNVQLCCVNVLSGVRKRRGWLPAQHWYCSVHFYKCPDVCCWKYDFYTCTVPCVLERTMSSGLLSDPTCAHVTSLPFVKNLFMANPRSEKLLAVG